MVSFLTLKVADVMTTALVTVQSDTKLSELRSLFDTHQFNAFPVMDAGDFAGWVTQFDFLNAFTLRAESIAPRYQEIFQLGAASIMVRKPECIGPEQSLNRTLMRMIETRHRSFPVISKNRLVGIIAREDILRGLKGQFTDR